jgi:hypothetical protein
MPMAPSIPTGDNLVAQSDPSANYGPSEILINPADWYQRIIRDHLKGST